MRLSDTASEGNSAGSGQPLTLNWLSDTAFEKPHSLRRGNRLILQVRNRGDQRFSIICFSNMVGCTSGLLTVTKSEMRRSVSMTCSLP